MGGIRRYRAATVRVPLPLLFAAALLPRILGAQAGPRTDTPPKGKLRISFDPIITTYERQFFGNGHQRQLAAPLDSITTLYVRTEQRITPLRFDFGITNRISVGAY